MNYSVVSTYEWMYPDITEYKSSKRNVKMSALGNGYATFQIFVDNIQGKLTVSSEIDCEIYEEIPVVVESNPELQDSLPLVLSREAPYQVFDCLKPYNEGISNSTAGVYIAIKTQKNDIIGEIVISDDVCQLSIPVEIRVSKAVVPEETLQIVMGMSVHKIYRFHKVENPEEIESIVYKYRKMLRRMHQNRMYIGAPYPHKEDNKWIFSYGDNAKTIREALKLGFKHFHITGIGFRRSWSSDDIMVCGMNSNTPEADEYIREYMHSLKAWMEENDFPYSMFSIGIADEPNQYNTQSYSTLAKKVKSYFPELSLYDAVSAVDIEDVLDIWIPRSDEYEKRIELFDEKKQDHEVWQYVCLYPRGGGYINRFLDLPLLSTRFIYWGNYLYNLSGYLHWTVNDYQEDKDPFLRSCALHHNADSETILPPGDDKIVYPGTLEPWMSLRLENQRESAEEYEMLRAISIANKAVADNICARALTSFHTPNYDLDNFYDLREELIREYERISL